MKRVILIIALFSFAFVQSACTYNIIEPGTPDVPDREVSFANDLQAIFNAKCITCHSSTSPVLTEGKSYTNLTTGTGKNGKPFVDVNNPETSVVYVQTLAGHPGGNALTPTEQAMLLKWIKEGAQNN